MYFFMDDHNFGYITKKKSIFLLKKNTILRNRNIPWAHYKCKLVIFKCIDERGPIISSINMVKLFLHYMPHVYVCTIDGGVYHSQGC